MCAEGTRIGGPTTNRLGHDLWHRVARTDYEGGAGILAYGTDEHEYDKRRGMLGG